MAYIPLIKRTKWTDLGIEHKRLRETVESDLKEGCCENGNIQPIMLRGAFGIGKTTALYYFFHYCWEVLQTPAFYMPLAKIVEELKKDAVANNSLTVENSRISVIVKRMINEQIGILKTQNHDDISDLAFPEFQSGDENVQITLTDYLRGFKPVEVNYDDSNANPFEDVVLDSRVISTALNTGNVPVLLVDEFESKFYELRKIVAISGGGILRDLYDQIVQSRPFQLIIANGPASGYELAKEFGSESESETAANRRLKIMQIPFPTAALLKRKFMEGSANGYVNFIWWMSRCRPGHIQRLSESVVYDDMSKYNSSEFITQTIFGEPIDEGGDGEEVKYLKSSFFDTLDSHIYPISKKLLLDLEPCILTMEKEYIEAFKDEKNAKMYFCSDEIVNVEKVICPALKDDLCLYLEKKCKDIDGKYLEINYYTHLNKYFSYILEACSDKDGNMVFNTPFKDEETALADSFLIPLLELTYDFVSQYEDAESLAIKEVKDFLLDCIKRVEYARNDDQISELFPELSDLFYGFKAGKSKGEEVYMQFSLLALREIFEQPIGSPILRYKGMSLDKKLEDIDFDDSVLLTNSNVDQRIIFIPDLEEMQMDAYLGRLEGYIENCRQELHENAYETLHVIYLRYNEKIYSLKDRIMKDGEELLPIAKYKKIEFEFFDDYKFKFGSHIQDYIDSLAKIVIAGCACGDLKSIDSVTMSINTVIDKIKDNTWTSQKEVRRTIEHYEKLVCEGENSILKDIERKSFKDYEDALEKAICDKPDYVDNIPCDFDKVVDGKVTDECSKYLALLYVIESAGKKSGINKSLTDLLEKIGTPRNGFYFSPKDDNSLQSISFEQLKLALCDTEALKPIYESYDSDDKFIIRLSSFADTMLTEEPAKDVEELFDFMKSSIKEHWISRYSDKMSYNCPKAEILLKLLYLFKYVAKMDMTSLRDALRNDLDVKNLELSKIRSGLAAHLNELWGLIYVQRIKPETEKHSYWEYYRKLTGVNEIFKLCRVILDEESDSRSALCLVRAVYSRLEDIVKSAKVFSDQLSDITMSFASLKEEIDNKYQAPIDIIYEKPLAATLVNLKSPDAQGYNFKGYNNSYCWLKARNMLRYSDKFQVVFEAQVDPVDKIAIKKEEVKGCCEYLSGILNTNSDIRSKLDNVLNICQTCEGMVNDYNELKSQIEELLKFE